MSTASSPTDAELCEVIQKLHTAEELQSVGIAKVVKNLKLSNSAWKERDAINTKRIRPILQELRSPHNIKSSEANAPQSSRNDIKSSEVDSGTKSSQNIKSSEVNSPKSSHDIKSSEANSLKSSNNHQNSEANSPKSSHNNPSSQPSTRIYKHPQTSRTRALKSRQEKMQNESFLLQNDKILELRNQTYGSGKNRQFYSRRYLQEIAQSQKGIFPVKRFSELEKAYAEAKTEEKCIIGFEQIFHLEWQRFLGPDPREPVAPAVEFCENLEALQFVTLFPYGRGHYLGPGKQPESFEDYVLGQLRDVRFQRHPLWLQWALTWTEDKELVAVLNLYLVIMHGFKARHVGEGVVKGVPIEDDFVLMKVDSSGKKLVKA